MFLTFKYRLLPTKKQHQALLAILASQRELYNAALQERIDCYRRTGRGRSLIDQQMALTECRAALPEMARLPVKLQRDTLRRLDAGFRSFFARIKRGETAGLPRFKGEGRFNSFGFDEFSGISFDGKRLRFKGLPGALRVHLHRPIAAGKICSAKFVRDDSGWAVYFIVRTAAGRDKGVVRSAVGVDVGVKTLATMSDGSAIPNPRIAIKAEREIRLRQRAVARARKGSRGRRKARAALAASYKHVKNARRTYLHQASARIVATYDLIAVENIQTAALARSTLAKHILDAGWSTFIGMVAYKAESAGKHLIKVDPRYTSQVCSSCETVVPKKLSVRTHECPHCGLVLDRDENAARNVLRKGVLALEALNVAQWGERAPVSIAITAIQHQPVLKPNP